MSEMIRSIVRKDEAQLSTHDWKKLYEEIYRAYDKLGVGKNGDSTSKSRLHHIAMKCDSDNENERVRAFSELFTTS